MVKKRFLPSKKEKRRYLAFEIISEDEINFKEVAGALSNSLIESLGYEAHIRLLTDKWNQESQRGIIRVNNRYLNELKKTLELINKVDHEEIKIRTLGVSGMLNKAEKRYLIAG